MKERIKVFSSYLKLEDLVGGLKSEIRIMCYRKIWHFLLGGDGYVEWNELVGAIQVYYIYLNTICFYFFFF